MTKFDAMAIGCVGDESDDVTLLVEFEDKDGTIRDPAFELNEGQVAHLKKKLDAVDW